MVLDASLCLKFVVCLVLIIQYASANHWDKAVQVENFLIASIAILLWGRYFKQRKRRKFGFQIVYPLVVPMMVYIVCTFIMNNLGGLGAGD